MDIQMTLNLIAYALIIAGVLLIGLRIFTTEEGTYGCRYALTFAWMCVIAGLVLTIVTLYVDFQWQNLLQEIAYAIILGGVFIAAPVVCHRSEAVCHVSKNYSKSFAWLSLVAGLVLLVIPVYLSLHLQMLLSTIAYALFIFSLICLMCKMFRSVLGAFAWLCLLAGFVLPIIAICQ